MKIDFGTANVTSTPINAVKIGDVFTCAMLDGSSKTLYLRSYDRVVDLGSPSRTWLENSTRTWTYPCVLVRVKIVVED